MSHDDKKLETDDTTEDVEASADATPLAEPGKKETAAAEDENIPEADVEAGDDEADEGGDDEAAAEAAAEAADEAADEGEAIDPVSRLQAELDDTKDRLLRAMAETENLRRRALREREDAGKYAISGFARDLLSGVDNLRRALDSLPDELRDDESLAALISGVEMTERELISVFERHGVRRIEPMGEKFDHNLHQAMFHVTLRINPTAPSSRSSRWDMSSPTACSGRPWSASPRPRRGPKTVPPSRSTPNRNPAAGGVSVDTIRF